MEPIFDARKAAGIIKQYLVEELHRLQSRIVLVERFGAHAVSVPALGRMGTDNIEQMMLRHTELVQQVAALEKAQNAASEAEIKAFVDSLRGRT